jgi:hypothetical protein
MDGNGGAFCSELERDAAPDAPRAAGDERLFSFQPHLCTSHVRAQTG